MSDNLPLTDNIVIYEGDDYSLSFKSRMADITGYTVTLQVRPDEDSRYAILVAKGTVTSPTDYTINIPSRYTLGKGREKAYVYGIQLTAPNGVVHTDRRGSFTIQERTTNLLSDASGLPSMGDVNDFIDTTGLEHNEMLKWDATKGKLVPSGVMSEEDGDLTTSTNSVNIGIHDVGSSGRNICITNLIDRRTFTPVFQELNIDDAHNTTAYQRVHESVTEHQFGAESVEIITNPSWKFTTTDNQTVFAIRLWPQINMKDVIYTIYENDIAIYHENLGSFSQGNNSKYVELLTPYDLYSNKEYKATLTCLGGSDAQFRGSNTGIPWYFVKLRKYEFKELATKQYVDDHAPATTMATHFVGIYQDLQSLKDAVTQPTQNLQAIVISPSESYYHYVGTDWVELAPVGAFHPNYLGAYDSVSDLNAAVTSPTKDSLAIVGTSAKSFYFYDGASWDMVTHTDIPALDNRLTTAEKTIVGNTTRIATAEGHLQTLQANDNRHDGAITVLSQEVKNLQDNQFTGMHVEDTDNNAFDDITSLHFDGATVSTTGSDANIAIKPKITVANGQAPGSTSETGNALIFTGASISTDVNDPNVIHVTIGNDTTTFKLSDGVGVAKDIHEMRLEGADIRSSDGIANIHIPFKHFKTIAERDTWKTAYQTIIKHDVIGVVDADDNGFVGWYRYDAATQNWKDYNAQGIIMTDSNGAIPKNIKTVVFGPGFSIQQAGDQEDAALVTYSGGGGGSPLTVAKQWGDYATVTAVDDISLLYPLEVIQGKSGPSTPTPGAAVMSINPQAYEIQHGNACLVKLDMVQTIAGQHPHSIYMSEEIVPTGEYFHLNAQGKGIDVQDSTGGDTSVTGGQMTEALVKVAFSDIAPEEGTVTVWLEYKDPSDPIDKKILIDVNGHPMAVSKHIGSGESIGDFIIAGAFMAKATQPLKVVVETSFNANSKIALDPVNTMLCLNQFSNGYETSVARIEFLRRAGLQITPAIQKFTNKMLSLFNEVKGISEPLTIIGAGEGGDTLNEFGIQNLTPVGVKIENGTLTVKDTGSIADFYVDTLIDNTHTRMLRGKQITSAITIANPNTAFEYEAYKWTGKPDHVTKVYSTRNNGSIVINDGWSVIKGAFIAEQVDGNKYGHTLTFDVPEDTNNILILVRPQLSQSPLTLELSEFDWGTTSDFTGYVEIERYNSHEQHLRFDETYAEYLLNSEGYQSLRYTINNTPPTGNPMPVGKLGKGKAPVMIDHTVNQVSGSQVPQFDGAIKFSKDGEASISKSYNVWNEQGTDNTVTFWDVLIDVNGNETKIPESEKTFTVPKNTGAPGVVYTIPAYAVDVEAGQRIGGRASTNKPDGAYVQTQNVSEFLVQTVVDFKELVVTSSDATDLVSAPLDKKLVVDRRVYPFTGNTAQNITITGLDIPDDVHLASVTAEKKLPTGSTSIEAVQHAYNRATQTLTVHVGSVSEGIIYLEFWA